MTYKCETCRWLYEKAMQLQRDGSPDGTRDAEIKAWQRLRDHQDSAHFLHAAVPTTLENSKARAR